MNSNGFHSSGGTRMKWFATMTTLLLVFLAIVPQQARAQGTFYMEETKDGRIYVFNNMKAYDEWKKGGEMGKSITRVGAGPNGETIVFDSEEAIHLYNFKHNLPGEVMIKTETPPPAVQDKLPYKFSGYVFGDYFYNIGRDENVANLPNVTLPGAEDFNGFVLRRAYFTFDDDISSDFSARFRLEANSGTTLANNNMTVFVKDAYLRWKNAIKTSDIFFGIQPTPAYEVSETQWRYRSLEKTIMDLYGIVPSRDFGVSLKGKLDAPGKYNYWVEFGNGSGNTPEVDNFKRLYLHFLWKPNDKFLATAYQDFRFLPDIPNPNDAALRLENNSQTTAFFLNYGVKDKYGLGWEFFWNRQENGTKIGAVPPIEVSDRTGFGSAAWGWYDFNPKIGLVGSWYYLEPNDNKAIGSDVRNLFMGSLVVRPMKNIWIMPNVFLQTFENALTGESFESAVTPRITMYWIFL